MSAGQIQVYSWGRGDLGALLQADDGDHVVKDGPVPLKEHWSVLQVGRCCCLDQPPCVEEEEYILPEISLWAPFSVVARPKRGLGGR